MFIHTNQSVSNTPFVRFIPVTRYTVPQNLAGRKVFREFLRSEYSEENIMFWLACEELKQETNPELVEEKARLIYEDFISILSPREVRNHKFD